MFYGKGGDRKVKVFHIKTRLTYSVNLRIFKENLHMYSMDKWTIDLRPPIRKFAKS